MTETITAKAKRILRERDDRVRIMESSDTIITAAIAGDHGMYLVSIVQHGPDNTTYDCDCPATRTCSHLLALEGYRMVRLGLATWKEVTE